MWLAVLILAGCSNAGNPSRPVAVLPSASEPDSDQPPIFRDVTASSGIQFTYRNGEEANLYTILESLGGGVGLIDYNRDGLLDIFLTGGGHFGGSEKKEVLGYPCRLYKNLGDFHFQDVTAEVGLDKLAEGQSWFYSNGVAVGDYDNDGWPDLVVTGYGRLALFHNDHGKFRETTREAELLSGSELHWGASAAWADVNNDGHPDLVVAQYVNWSLAKNTECHPPGLPNVVDVCPPGNFAPLLQRLYLNSGKGAFRDVSADAGLKPGKGLGVLVLDLDEDGRPDIYVATDTSSNQLYLNKGAGKFQEDALLRGVARDEFGSVTGSMGVDAADYDGSGHFSLLVSNFTKQAHALYHNRGKGWFQHASVRAGIAAIGLNFVGFGVGFLDYDNNGGEDVLITNGHVYRHPISPETQAQRTVLLRNLWRPGEPASAARFEDVSAQAGPYFAGRYRGRGLAIGDLDNDGRPDVVISNCEEPAVVLANVCTTDNHWLGVRLEGRPNRDAVGAFLTLESGKHVLWRAIKGGGSYLSANDPRVIFGLGSGEADRLQVRWPSGKTEQWDRSRLGRDRYITLIEGEGMEAAR